MVMVSLQCSACTITWIKMCLNGAKSHPFTDIWLFFLSILAIASTDINFKGHTRWYGGHSRWQRNVIYLVQSTFNIDKNLPIKLRPLKQCPK